MNTDEVISNDYCVGCGNCAFISEGKYRLGANSLIDKNFKSASLSVADGVIDKVCPFSDSSDNEDIIANKFYKDNKFFDSSIGYYNSIYAGWDNSDASRMRSSSGGLVSFLVAELIDSNKVDGAIVVVYDSESPNGVRYEIVRDSNKLEASRQSKYVVATYHDVLSELENTNGKFVFVGVPCYVKSIKLLAAQRPLLANKIVYTVAIFCGHQKTFSFPQYIAWNLGVSPEHLKIVNYRVKKEGFRSYEYFYQAVDDKDVIHEKVVTKIKWLDWGVGLFKLKACDVCDDVTGETADIIFGDAWVRPYTLDHRGTNVVVCRNAELEEILLLAKNAGKITLIPETKETIIASQAANYRHRKEGLLSRIDYFKSMNIDFPVRRESLYKNFRENVKRGNLYIIRHKLSERSHFAFEESKRKNDLNLFYSQMDDIVSQYFRSVTSIKTVILKHLRNMYKILFFDRKSKILFWR